MNSNAPWFAYNAKGPFKVRGFLGTALSLFRVHNPAINNLAASLASELRLQPELPALVLSLAPLPSHQRTDSLLRTARQLRGQWDTLGAFDALKRIAGRPDLFTAVAIALRATNEKTHRVIH